MRRGYSKFFPITFYFLDLLVLNASFFIALFIKFGSFQVFGQEHLSLLVLFNIVWSVVFYLSGLYEIQRTYKVIQSVRKIMVAIVIFLSIISIIWVGTKAYYYSREHLFYTFLFFSLTIICWRISFIYLLRYLRTRGYNIRNVVIVGFGEIGRELLNFFRRNPQLGFHFQGFFDNHPGRDGIIGDIGSVSSYARTNGTDVIFCCLPNLYHREVKQLIDFAENNLIQINVLSDFRGFAGKNMEILNYGSIPVLNISSIPLDKKVNRVAKRTFDIIFSSLIVLLILSWLLPVLAVLIKLESRGPVFFKQDRNGKGNKTFKILKLRTMAVHEDKDVQQASRNDPRITWLGAILRRTSLDELPQFFNVLAGDMSVIGPRPHAVKHNEEFNQKLDRFMQRHAVKPGITGLAQAKGYRGETKTFDSISGRVKLDRFYVKNWSLFLDIKIVFLTIFSIIKGNENAY